ncbi:MAG: hypothetical protein NTZ95_04870 [Candidatus Omnitrophica bacterium]|nr:hypothetical protein [Candidatus Omnitrophota bacterium]
MKKNVLATLFVFIIISLVLTDDVFAGAWTVPKHKVWLEYYTKIGNARKYFNSNGNLTSTPSSGANSFRDQVLTMEPKIEFGVTDWLTALASVESKAAQYKEYQRPEKDPYGNIILPEGYTVKNHDIVNVKVGGRWRIMDAPFVLSTQTKVFIYTGYGINHGDKEEVGFKTYLEDRRNLPCIGYGNDSLEQRILIGKTFSLPMTEKFKLPCYAGAEFGYRWNNRGVRNGIPWFLEGGFWPFSWLLLKSELDAYGCQGGPGKVEGSYGIWRAGAVWQVFGGDSVLRQGNKLFNLEFDYGITAWGKNTTAYREYVMKVQTQF